MFCLRGTGNFSEKCEESTTSHPERICKANKKKCSKKIALFIFPGALNVQMQKKKASSVLISLQQFPNILPHQETSLIKYFINLAMQKTKICRIKCFKMFF